MSLYGDHGFLLWKKSKLMSFVSYVGIECSFLCRYQVLDHAFSIAGNLRESSAYKFRRLELEVVVSDPSNQA